MVERPPPHAARLPGGGAREDGENVGGGAYGKGVALSSVEGNLLERGRGSLGSFRRTAEEIRKA